MDAFYAAVEQHDRPELRGKPLLIGGLGPRSVVATASYEARPFGVGSAMSMIEARRRCPQAIVVAPRMARYQEVSDQLLAVFDDFSPRVEALSLDEAFLDMAGTEKLFGPQERMAKKLKLAVLAATGLRVSVGVAANKYVAKVASDLRKPDALVVVPPEATLEFLAPLRVSRLWGVGKKGQETLQGLGLHTIGQVAVADPAWLLRELGALGAHVHALANGVDPRPVECDREAKSLGAEQTLDVDVRGADAILPLLRHSADRVAFRLRRSGLRAGGLRVKLKTARFELHTRQTTLRPPTDAAADLMQAAQVLLGQFDLRPAMRLVGLAAFDLADAQAPVQGELFGEVKRTRQRSLDRALDALNEKFGHGMVRRASDTDDGYG